MCSFSSTSSLLALSRLLHDPHAPRPSFPFSSSEGDCVISDERVLQAPSQSVVADRGAGQSHWPTGLEAPAWPCSDRSPVKTPDSPEHAFLRPCLLCTHKRGPSCPGHRAPKGTVPWPEAPPGSCRARPGWSASAVSSAETAPHTVRLASSSTPSSFPTCYQRQGRVSGQLRSSGACLQGLPGCLRPVKLITGLHGGDVPRTEGDHF